MVVSHPVRTAAPGGPAGLPIIDGREQLNWGQRLPARLGTGALWLGSFALLGPLKVMGMLLFGSLLAPCFLLLDRDPRGRRVDQAEDALTCPLVTPAGVEGLQPGLPRSALAEELGLPESQLFRARHAAVCTIRHNPEGQIVAIQLPGSPKTRPLPYPDAHPVG